MRDPPGDKQRHDMMMMDGRSDFKPCRDEATFETGNPGS